MKPKLNMPPGKVTYVRNYVVIYNPVFPKDRAEELFNQGFRLVSTVVNAHKVPIAMNDVEYIFERLSMGGADIEEFTCASV